MDRFHVDNAALDANAENSLLHFGRAYQSFAELLGDDREDYRDVVATKRQSTSRKSIDQLNSELAEIAVAELATMRTGEWDGVWSADCLYNVFIPERS